MSDTVIQVDDLWKRYRVGVLGTGTLRHDLNRWWHRIRGKEDLYSPVDDSPNGRVKDGEKRSQKQKAGCAATEFQTLAASPAPSSPALAADEMWALRGVSFEMKQGEILGIIGRNGAGKSTLLKLLSSVTGPTRGEIRAKGRIASLLEVGSGFHPDLTGRENVFLNGGILGMSRAEIKAKFDEIIAFAEIERYVDTPVKRYSSGMYMRLAFGVAAHLDPEILILDEVLAVGDAEFQKKCLGKMKDVAGQGRTILFVSHNMEAVRNLCQRAIWLKNGQLYKSGLAEDIVDAYFHDLPTTHNFASSKAGYGLDIQSIKLKNSQGKETRVFQPGDDLIVEIHYHAHTRLEKPYITLGVLGISGSCFTANMLLDGARPQTLEGCGVIACSFKSIPLLPQTYTINLAVRAKDGLDWIIEYQEVTSFKVTGNLADYGYKGDFLERATRYTPVVVPYEWKFPDGTKTPISLNKPLA
jgi:lipopolysaccharide transport system ATP-binding protein